DFRVNQRMTWNFGLRYQYNGYPIDARGRFASFDRRFGQKFTFPPPEGTFAGMAVPANANVNVPTGFTKLPSDRLAASQNRLGFSPRIGLTYRPIATDENFVVRAGYGVYWAQMGTFPVEQAFFDPWVIWNVASGVAAAGSTFQNPFQLLPP